MALMLIAAVICLLLWLLVAVARGWLSFRWMACPTIVAAVVILVGSIFGRDFFSVDFGPLPITLDRILWTWMIAQFALLIFTQRVPLARFNALDLLVGGLLVLLSISTLSHDFTDRGYLPLTRLLFFNFMPIGIYFVVRNTSINSRQITWILRGLVVFGTYLAVTAIAEWQNWPQFIFPSYIIDPSFGEFLGRARGPFLNPVACGIFQIVAMVAAISFWPRLGTRDRWLIGVLIVLFFAGIFVTFTRSVWISLAFSLAIALWLPATIRRRGVLLMVGASAVALLVAVFSDDINAFKRDKNVTESDMSESLMLRPLMAEVAGQMFIDRPVFGHGFGQYSKAKRLYHQQVTNEPLKRVLPYMQHNVVLSYLTETGAVGTILLLGIIVLYGALAFRVYSRSPPGSPHNTVGLLGLVTLSSYLINGMFHDVSLLPMVASLFYFLLGLNNHLDTTRSRLFEGSSADVRQRAIATDQRLAS